MSVMINLRTETGYDVREAQFTDKGDLICPVCAKTLWISSYAEDGESDLADWWECEKRDGDAGCSASGAYVKADNHAETANGHDAKPLYCLNCGHVGEMKADYYEAVWQHVSGNVDFYDYTGHYGSYDDGSTDDECLRCPECWEEVRVMARLRMVPIEVLARVDKIINAHQAKVAAAEMEGV